VIVDGIWQTSLVCYIRALDTTDGSQRWATATPIHGVPNTTFDYAMRAVPLDSASTPGLVVACGGTLRGIAASDGSTKWEVADNVTDLRVVERDGENQLLLADAAHIARRSLDTGALIATLKGFAEAVVDLGSDDNLVVREHDGTLARLDAMRGVFSDGPIPIGDGGEDFGVPAALTLDTLSPTGSSVQLFANATYGVVQIRMSKDASIFRDTFEASMLP
jgi:hypothetical protein